MNDLGCHDVEPVFNPEAIRDYYFLDNYGVEKETLQDLIMKAKQHLAAVGWTFRYIFDKYSNRKKVKFVPPNGGKQHTTLRTACKFHLECEDGGVEEIKSADKCGKKRKARYDDEKNEIKDFERKDEEMSLCLDNRQFSFDDLEMEDGVKEVQRKMRALHLENGEFKFDDSESHDSGKNINVGKAKLNNENGNQKMDRVVEVHEIREEEEEEEVREISLRKFKKKKVRFVEEVYAGEARFNALDKRKKRITACDLYGERMLRCMQGI